MAKVSILMNGYNAQQYLKEAIDSIYIQTFEDWEIIFIDNCSTDNTAKIAQSYDERIQYHKTKGRILTVIGVHPTVRQGIIQHEDGIITKYSFDEPVGTIIKGGYFLVKPRVFEYLTEDCILENEPFQRLISEGQAVVFDHEGFWKQVDSWRDLEELERLFEKDSNVSWMIK